MFEESPRSPMDQSVVDKFDTGAVVFEESLSEEDGGSTEDTQQLYERYELYLANNATSGSEDDSLPDLDIASTVAAGRRKSRFSALKDKIGQPFDASSFVSEIEVVPVSDEFNSKAPADVIKSASIQEINTYLDTLLTEIDEKTAKIQDVSPLAECLAAISSEISSAAKVERKAKDSIPMQKILNYANVMAARIKSISAKISEANTLIDSLKLRKSV